MNKKVLSALLFGALTLGTGTFTSCIDNEEPAGIEELRGAKAELLRAKAAVEAAKVALVQAEAAAAQAEADLKKAQAAAVQAESAAEIARIQAETEAAIARAEAARLEAEISYQKAILELKSLQATLVGDQAAAIAGYVQAYDEALATYNKLVAEQTEAQRELNNHLAVTEEKESKKELFTRELSRKVTLAEAALEGEKAALVEAQENLAAAKELEPHALAVKLEELEAQKKAINLAVVDLKLEAAEAMYAFFKEGRMKEVQDSLQAYNDLWNEELEIAAVEFDFGDGAGYPTWVKRGVTAFDEDVYTAWNTSAYYNRKSLLEAWLNEFKSWTRDENNNAWTQERIVKLEGELKDFNDNYLTPAKKAWAEAVAAYNTGKYNETDPSKISGYDKVIAELTAFNKAMTDRNAAYAALVALDTKAADKKAWDDAVVANKKAYDAAVKAAKDAFDAAMKAETLEKTVETKTKALAAAAEEAKKAVEKAQKDYETELAGEADLYKLTALASLLDKAEKAYVAAADEAAAYSAAVEIDAIKKTYGDALIAAEKAQTTADAAAEKAYTDKWDAEKGTAVAATAAAKKTAQTAEETAGKACEALKKAAEAYNANISEVGTVISMSDIEAAHVGAATEAGYYASKTIEAKDLFKLNKESLIWAVRTRSELVFGTNVWDWDAYDEYEARLKEITVEEIAALIAANEEIDTYSEYINACNEYGYVGRTMIYAEQIRLAKSWLTNGELIEAKIAQAQEALDTLVAAYEAHELALEESWEAYETVSEKLDADAKATMEPFEAKMAELEPLQHLYRAYVNAFNDYKKIEEGVYTQSEIDAIIAGFEKAIKTAEAAIYDAETRLMWAKEDLAKWNAGDVERTSILQAQLERATAAVATAHEALVIAQTRLQQAMSSLEWTAAE